MLWLFLFELMYGCLLFFDFSYFAGVCFRSSFVCNLWFSSDFAIIFDFISYLSLFMLLCCGVGALLFYVHYFFEVESKYLIFLMLVFLQVMVLLVLSGSFMTTVVLWEYLGFLSFLLILFYSNMKSFRAAVVTLISSRIGDVGLFCVFCWMCNDFGAWGGLIGCLIFFVVCSKSAGYPLTSWLVEAMRAPTPVSSLVHSSTLVAAGVWFLIRYNEFFDVLAIWLIFVSASVTIVISAVCACRVADVKQVVAFSTCNNIGWCLLYFICGDVFLSVCQLLLHGLCKSFLFMCVGDLMVSSGSSQSSVNIVDCTRLGWISCFLNAFLTCCLCGLPLLGVFFTKHEFLAGCLFGGGLFFFLFLVFGFFMSHVYSFRFISVIAEGGGDLSASYSYCFSALCCFIFVTHGIGLLLEGFFGEAVVLESFWNGVLIWIQVLGCLFGVVVWSFHARNPYFVSQIFGCNSFVVGFFLPYVNFSENLFFSLFRWEAGVLNWFVGLEPRGFGLFGLGLNGALFVGGLVLVFYLGSLFS